MNDEKIVLIARLKVKKDAVEEAKQAALAIVAHSRRETGCVNYDFHQAIEEATIFVWHETWANKAALEAHGKTEHFKQFSAAVKDITDEPLQLTLIKMVSEKA